ncbi:MAG: anthranilate synthase component I [bacterium]
MRILGFSEFAKLVDRGNVIPVYATYLADLLTPVSAFLKLQQISGQTFLLESVEGGEKTARYSFLGCNPFCTIKSTGNTIEAKRGASHRTFDGNIYDYMKTLLNEYHAVHPAGLPRFTGGAVGYFGYETIQLIEDIPVHKNPDIDVPEALFMLFDIILVFDHLTHAIYIINNVFLDREKDRDLKSIYQRAMAKINSIRKSLEADLKASAVASTNKSEISSNFTQTNFEQAVDEAKKYIRAGDIFQVVLSQKFKKTISVDPFTIYRALRVINPSPYLYYLQVDDFSIIGSSPELLVRVEDRVIEVRPIAGTRPRGKTPADDARYMEELRHDEKELAEHVMLVDLGRNDVGRVSEFGSVEVTEFKVIEKYSHVMHLVSNVRGKLKPGLTAVDALKACFPAGTVSGAPKIRAMEIIAELEPTARGVYAGALGYFDFSGNMDTCIAIRTIIVKGDQAFFQAGAGIVADSVPEREYDETLNKASALRTAIEFAEQGLQ